MHTSTLTGDQRKELSLNRVQFVALQFEQTARLQSWKELYLNRVQFVALQFEQTARLQSSFPRYHNGGTGHNQWELRDACSADSPS